MWAFIARALLRNRILVLIVLGLITVMMIYFAQHATLFYGLPRLLPADDETYLAHLDFNERFKTESTVFVIGMEEDPLQDLELFNALHAMGSKVSAVPGVDTVISLASVFYIEKDTAEKRFAVKPVVEAPLKSKAELDSIRSVIESLVFFDGLIYNSETRVSLIAISVDNDLFNSNNRGMLLENVLSEVRKFEKDSGISLKYSGLAYIRTVITDLVKRELQMFIIMAIVVTFLILLLFFKSFKPVLVSMVVVGLGVTWSLGVMGMLGFQITILTSIIPPLVIVIGIPNCIFLINKYHSEFKAHGNKTKALTRVVQKIGKATFMTNATTAVGFLTFIFTQSDILVEFGIVASLNIMLLFCISLCMITVSFSFLDPPKERHTKHLDTKWVRKSVDVLVHIVTNHRKIVYTITVILVLLGFYGVSLVQTTGNMVDDLPEDHQVSTDLAFFEKHFKGIMPLEVSIDTKKPKQVTNVRVLEKLDKLQALFYKYPQFSKPVSIVEGIKFTKQAFYNGDSSKYDLISNQEKAFFKDYIENAEQNKRLLDDFVDSTNRYTRISLKMADVGTIQMDSLIRDITPRIDSLINPGRTSVDSLYQLVVSEKGKENKEGLLRLFFKENPKYARNIRRTYAADSAVMDRLGLTKKELKDSVNFEQLFAETTFEKTLGEAIDQSFINVVLTGTSVVFLKGTNYLVKNLFISLSIAVFIVALIMATFFSSFRMIIVSLITNMIPLLLTAASMGYFGISIKPSTILVFSIAFGISVDDTIHFLAKYRQELKYYNWNIGEATVAALKETGVSMIYTSIILFFGFSVFDSSDFGGTKALGLLVSFTLLVAMLANLVLLPSFLLSLEKSIVTKSFKEPLIEIYDEEEDIDLDELKVQKNVPHPQHLNGNSTQVDQQADETSEH